MLNKYRAVSEQSCVGCQLTFIYVFICNLGVRWARQLRRGAAKALGPAAASRRHGNPGRPRAWLAAEVPPAPFSRRWQEGVGRRGPRVGGDARQSAPRCGPQRWGGSRGGRRVRVRAARERASASPRPPQGRWVARGSQGPGPRGGGGGARAAAAGGGLGAPAMSQAERKGGAALEVKFVPDEAVLRHIADDAGTAGPAPRRGRGCGEGEQPGPGAWQHGARPRLRFLVSLPLPPFAPAPARGGCRYLRLEGSPAASTAPCSSLSSPPSFSAP